MNGQVSEENSRKIVNLSFLCAIFVCLIHVRWQPATDFGRTLVFMVRGVVGAVGVPFFFLVSGFFLARRFGEPGWWRTAIRKRIGSLLVPYCAWQLVNALVWLAIEGRWSLRPGNFGLNPFVHPKLVPLWYVRSLMILVVASPLLFAAVKRWGRGFLGALFVLNCAMGVFVAQGLVPETSRAGALLYYTFSLLGVLYFSVGAYLAGHPMTLSRRAGNWCGVAALALGVVRLAIFHFRVTVPFDLCVFVLPTLMAFLWAHTPATRLPAVLAQAVFPVYLMHVVLYDVLDALGLLPGAFRAWAEPVFGVGLAIVISGLLHRFSPRLARVLFGGR